MKLDTIYIVRHGIAEDYADSGRDGDRRLTEIGIERTKQVVAGLERIGVAPQLILSSPLVRADETARIAANGLGGASVRTTDHLRPGFDFDRLFSDLLAPPKPTKVMVVGHQPDLGMLASWLMTGDPEAAYLPFRKAATACLATSGNAETPHATLQWFLEPAHARALAAKRNK